MEVDRGALSAGTVSPREDEFLVESPVRLGDVVTAYWGREKRTEEVVRSAPNLRDPCVGVEGSGQPAHVLLNLPEPIDLRWVLLHLIEETAHHAGHADATRQLLDGRKTRA